MKSKITKQDIYTRLAIVEAKLDKVLDLIQDKSELKETSQAIPVGIPAPAPCTLPDFIDVWQKKLGIHEGPGGEPKVTYGCVPENNESIPGPPKPFIDLDYCKSDAIKSNLSSYCRDPENPNINKGTIRISGDLSI